MSYTDSTQIKNFLQRDLNAYETASLGTLIPAIKKFIDAKLGSTFDQAAETTRYYTASGRLVNIDNCMNISSVKAVDIDPTVVSEYTYTLGNEYIAEPQNETVKNQLIRRNGTFAHGLNRIAVTAVFSEYDGAVPSDIQVLATRLAGLLIMQGKTSGQSSIDGGNVKSEKLEGHEIVYTDATASQGLEGIALTDPTVASILTSRRELLVDDTEDIDSIPYDEY